MARYGTLLWLLVLLTGGPVAAGEPADLLAAATIDIDRLGAHVPSDVVLEDATGRKVRVGDLVGERPVLLAPVDFDCRNICGFTLAGLLAAAASSNGGPGRNTTS